MGRQQASAQQVSRPKRKATNAHVFRYLQTRNPSRLEENDLKRALEASLEECPDFWPEDSASCSSSERSNSTSVGSSANNTRSLKTGAGAKCSSTSRHSPGCLGKSRRRSKSSIQHHQHLNQQHANQPFTANQSCCPMSCAHNRYKPVAMKNIYSEADFFHDGIMEYIEFALSQTKAKEC